MLVEDAKEAKVELEKNILELVKDYEIKTGLEIKTIDKVWDVLFNGTEDAMRTECIICKVEF